MMYVYRLTVVQKLYDSSYTLVRLAVLIERELDGKQYTNLAWFHDMVDGV